MRASRGEGRKGHPELRKGTFKYASALTGSRSFKHSITSKVYWEAEESNRAKSLERKKNRKSPRWDWRLDQISKTKCGWYRSFITLPKSIGRLKNLTELNLWNTKKIESLPDEIGNLTKLQRLNLSASRVSSLPKSIGKLKNLTDLDLYGAKKIESIPDGIGNLTNLQKLKLYHSGISSFPASIQNLKNLEELQLYNTEDVLHLPNKIGDLTNLRKLTISQLTIITALPAFLRKLANLWVLDLYRNGILKRVSSDQIIFDVTQQCRFLGCFGDCLDKENPEFQRLTNELSLNRPWSRVVCQNDNISFPPALWPLVLQKELCAFKPCYYCFRDDCFCRFDCANTLIQIDAVFHLLVEHGAKDIFFRQNWIHQSWREVCTHVAQNRRTHKTDSKYVWIS